MNLFLQCEIARLAENVVFVLLAFSVFFFSTAGTHLLKIRVSNHKATGMQSVQLSLADSSHIFQL